MKELIHNKLVEAKRILEEGNGNYEYYIGQIDAYTYLLQDLEDYNINSLYTLN
jgi:hypothetical protein